MIKYLLKLFVLVVIVFVSYIKFYNLYDINLPVTIRWINYTITIDILVAIFIVLLTYVLIAILIKILNLPKKVISLFVGTQDLDLLKMYAFLVTNKKEKLRNILNKKNLSSNSNTIHWHLLSSYVTESFDQKITDLHELLKTKEYYNFAAKELAKIFLNLGPLEQNQASILLLKALDIDSKDIQALDLLSRTYAKLKIWDKFNNIVNKLSKINSSYVSSIGPDIAKYYLSAAEGFLAEANTLQAEEFLEKALIHKPDFIQAIKLYCEVNLTLGHKEKNIDIIEKAFSYCPSVELFKLYMLNSTLESEQLYEKLSVLADPNRYEDVFVVINAYLKLSEVSL